MGASSCLRIIVCAGGDNSDQPPANDLENKSSVGDKRGWSFRKKSGRQRGVVITSVVSDTTPAVKTRETLESALLNSPSPDNNKNNNNSNGSQKEQSFNDEKKKEVAVVDEKKTELSVPYLEEDIELPVLVESKGTETEEDDLVGTEHDVVVQSVVEKDISSEVKIAEPVVDESVVIIIQAAIRGYLARRELLRHKKVVKLQAAVRGHLVRSQAKGSLRCVHAIVKMQAMVRARHSTKDGSRVSAISDKADTNVSAQKLLQNKFAKHLMESTPKTKPISIKCDPTKPSSAWYWLERWMPVSKPEKASSKAEEQYLEETQSVEASSQADFVDSKAESGLSSYETSKLEPQLSELSETDKGSQYDTAESSEESHPLNEQPKHSLKRKASNPSFIAAQSKFEELTSSADSKKAMNLSSKHGEEGKTAIASSEVDAAAYSKQDHSVEDVALADHEGSECGTELSVTSSLDSVDKKSDIEDAESKVGANKLSEQAELIEIDFKHETPPLETVEDPKEKVEDEAVVTSVQQESVINTPDSKKRQAEEALSPMTITESQATPASQASSSVTIRKGKSNKSGSSQKRRVSKRITSSPKQETPTIEVNATEPKSGRRNSFGFEQEARESSGSGGKNSLPRFMQPTQSAKAKVQEHNSPRSSPDLQERDVATIKKRHSLPVAATNGKQGTSPRIQRSSSSQAQQGTKDRKWQR